MSDIRIPRRILTLTASAMPSRGKVFFILDSSFRISRVRFFLLICAALCALVLPTLAENAAFDLIGPKVEVRVQRNEKTLPISEVPNLQAGDRLWVHPNLPDTQSVHYLMVVVFLRGATNPPPDSWFTRVEAWSKPVHEEGVFVVVPDGAEEALVLLAPDTGGAFSTLKNAVRGKPGAFVRAAQDLQQASLDRARLEKYLEEVRLISSSDPEQLKAHTTLLARSLNIRLEQQCFDKPTAQQGPCLTQNTDLLVLDDAHSQNMVASLTSGTPTDLVAQISATPTAHAGYYSPYIGAVVDLAHILGTAHSAQYQYIPALSLPKQNDLNLRLNNPPSFRNPKSVIVIGLPPIHAALVPPLKALDANQVFCLQKPGLVLPAEGAPLTFATELAHNFVLHLETKSAAGIDLPATADPESGGFAIDTQAAQGADLDPEVSGNLRGVWGFQAFDGPRYRLRISHSGSWVVASKDASALIVGREDTLHLQSTDACCVSSVSLRDEKGKTVETEWKAGRPDELEVKVPLQSAAAGSLVMSIKKFGLREADDIPLHTYSEAGRLDAFDIHAGDGDGVLRGTRLDQVTGVDVNGLRFDPGALSRANQHDELKLTVHDSAAAAKLTAGEAVVVRVALQDGRFLTLNTSVRDPRPKVTMLNKNVQFDPEAVAPIVRLGNSDELPQDAHLSFFLKTQVPENFPPTERIEVATSDESFRVLLSFKDGNLTMQDSKTVYAVLDPMKLLGPSAFGPLKFRPVSAEGIEGDWQPLINLVRFPVLTGVRCVTLPEKQCTLSGDKLFLIDAVSTDPDFANPVTVPDGFVEASLIIPFPKGKTIYLKLRDDPATVDSAVVPVSTGQAAAKE
jgi:hypothetical protein